MSNRSASRNAVGPWSRPFAAGNPSTRSPRGSGSARPPSCAGSGGPTAWARGAGVTAPFVVERLVEHWRQFGLPAYAQFDNDTTFHGSHAHPDIVGRVSRLCLSLEVVPVFVPPRETGFQAAVEAFNGSWQARVWARFRHHDLAELRGRSQRHVAALRGHRAARIEAAPPRRPFPRRWELD